MSRRLLRIAALAASLGVLTLAPAASTRAAGPSSPAATWNVVAPLPQALSGAAAAGDPLYFAYLFGGSPAAGSVVDTAYRWNSVNERWEERAPMPDAVEGASAVYVPSDTDPKVYVFGGVDPSTGTVSTATRIYDVFANSWSAGADLPAARSFMASGYNAANGKIYLVGGKSAAAAAENTTWEYTPGTNTFATKSSIANAVAGAAGG